METLASGRRVSLHDKRHPVRSSGLAHQEETKTLPTTPAPPQFKEIRGAALSGCRRMKSPGTRSSRRCTPGGRTENSPEERYLWRMSRSLLQTTWGVQGYLQTNAFGKLPFKTSPSGGARHPGEVYLMALRVDGLERGMYHYQARDHRLARLPAKASPRMASAYCADQPYSRGRRRCSS